jgi:hypothetical protein
MYYLKGFKQMIGLGPLLVEKMLLLVVDICMNPPKQRR